MRHLIDLVESPQGFALHPSLDPSKYQITDSLGDVERWKAYVYDGNSIGEGDARKGQMGDIGYTMISKTTNYIIPIARSDEHNRGFDTLYGLSRKYPGIDPKDFVPLFYGSNYIYSTNDIPVMLNVVSKWLAYGGKDGILEGANMRPRMAITLKQFVALKGKINVEPGELAPVGKALLQAYQGAADALRLARQNPEKKSAVNAAFVASLNVIKVYSTLGYLILGPLKLDDVRNAVPAIRELKERQDLQGLEEFMFGFHSLKNTMHNALRDVQKRRDAGETDMFGAEKLQAMWGDIKLAIDALGRF